MRDSSDESQKTREDLDAEEVLVMSILGQVTYGSKLHALTSTLDQLIAAYRVKKS